VKSSKFVGEGLQAYFSCTDLVVVVEVMQADILATGNASLFTVVIGQGIACRKVPVDTVDRWPVGCSRPI
jgi:hypothetical protein